MNTVAHSCRSFHLISAVVRTRWLLILIARGDNHPYTGTRWSYLCQTADRNIRDVSFFRCSTQVNCSLLTNISFHFQMKNWCSRLTHKVQRLKRKRHDTGNHHTTESSLHVTTIRLFKRDSK